MDLSHLSLHAQDQGLSVSHRSLALRSPGYKSLRKSSTTLMKQQQQQQKKKKKKQTLNVNLALKQVVWARSEEGEEEEEEEEEEEMGKALDRMKEQGGMGLTMAVLSVTSGMAREHINPWLGELCSNPTFMAGLLAWSLSQAMKVISTWIMERRWDVGMLVGCGGMPSSHAALCMALTTSVAVSHGISNALFPVCLGFTLIVMYDAIGVRWHAGMQAQVLNVIVKDRFQGHPVKEKKLKEILGHTPLQVFAGAIVGIMVGYLCRKA